MSLLLSAVLLSLVGQTNLNASILGVRGDQNMVFELNPNNGNTIRTFAQGLVQSPMDIDLIPGTRLAAIADAGSKSIKVIDVDSGALEKTINLPLQPRYVTATSSSNIVVWFLNGFDYGIGYDLETNLADSVFNNGGLGRIDGVRAHEKRVYGVSSSGRIVRWNKAGGDPVYVSQPWAGGAYSSKPINGGDGWMYGLVRDGGNVSGMQLKRFRPIESPTWDQNFGTGTAGWRFSNYMAIVKKGEIMSIAHEPSSSFGFSYWSLSGSGSWRKIDNHSLRFDGLVGLQNRRGLPEISPIAP
jgi:hypothetical protein